MPASAQKTKPIGSVQGRPNTSVSSSHPKTGQARNGIASTQPSRPSPTLATQQTTSRVTTNQTSAPALPPQSNQQQPPLLEPQRRATEPVKRLSEPPKLSQVQAATKQIDQEPPRLAPPELSSLPAMSPSVSLDSGPPLLEIQPLSPDRPMQPLSKPEMSRTSVVMSEPPYLDTEDPNDWGVEETIAQVSLKKNTSLHFSYIQNFRSLHWTPPFPCMWKHFVLMKLMAKPCCC